MRVSKERVRAIAGIGRSSYLSDNGGKRVWLDGRGRAHARESLAQAFEKAKAAWIPQATELAAGSFLLRRKKAMGDILALTATARALELAGAEVSIVCGGRYEELLSGAFPVGQIREGQTPIVLDGWLERHPGRAGRPAAACFGDYWNLDVEDCRPVIALDEAEKSWGRFYTEQLRAGATHLALVFERAGWSTRTYDRMREVGQGLADAGVAVFGPEGAGMGLRELAAIIGAADLVVCADMGPLHLAAAVGTPSVAVFGATSAAGSIGGGYNCTAIESQGLECWPCWRSHCEGPDPLTCIRGVSPREVTDAAAGVLRDGPQETAE